MPFGPCHNTLTCLTAVLLTVACDLAPPEQAHPFTGAWTGTFSGETRTVIGGGVVTAPFVFSLEMRLEAFADSLAGVGTLTSRHRPGPEARYAFTVTGGPGRTCGAGGCTPRDSSIALLLRFPPPAAFDRLHLDLTLARDGRTMTGSAAGAAVHGGQVHVAR